MPAALLGASRAAREHDERRLLRVRAGHRVDHVQAARAIGDQAHAEAVGDAGAAVGGKSHRRLVAEPNQPEAAVAFERLEEIEREVARETEDVADTVFPQLVEEEGAERHVVDYRSVALRVSEDDATVVGLPGMLFAPRVTRSVAMPEQTVIERVEILERNVELLEALPAARERGGRPSRRGGVADRATSQRDARRVFRRARGDARRICRRARRDACRVSGGARRICRRTGRDAPVRRRFSAVRGEMAGMRDSLLTVLRAEIREGDEETRRYMRVLHEDLVARIALLQNGRRPRKKA